MFPFISVVIPLYNKRATVARALNSVLNQTFQDFEIIVVNDGSTDGSAEVVRRHTDSRIRVIEQPNRGVSAARNAGIAAASNEAVALLDADDEWKPAFLETIQNLRRDFPEAAVWATNYDLICSDGSACPTRIRGLPMWPWRGMLDDYFAIAAVSDPPLWSSALAVSKSAITAIGGFPVGITSGEDLLTWARLAARHHVAYDSQSLARFHAPERILERPGRFKESTDDVAAGLLELMAELPESCKGSIRRYLALWHTMHASVLLEQGNGHAARREARRAIDHSKANLKLLGIIALGLLPRSLGSLLLVRLRRVRRCARQTASD